MASRRYVAVVAGAAAVLWSGSDAAAQSGGSQGAGGVTIASGVNSLTLGARMQFRWTAEHREAMDADLAGAGAGREDGLVSQFDVPRLRMTLAGGAFRPWMRYQFQFDFSRTGGEGASKIKDAVLEIRPAGSPVRVAAGQFKVPFGLQQLVSSGRQQFVDRAITDAKFAPGRDMGVMIAGAAADGRLGYEAGIFNGAGESVRQNNASHLWAGRVFVQPLGSYALTEGATESGEDALLHAGVGVRGGKQIRGRSAPPAFEEADNQLAVDVEIGARLPRFHATFEHYWMTDEQQHPVAGPDVRSRGFHAQAGYAVMPRTAEVGLRVARILGDVRADDAAVTEVRGVFGYFWQSHGLKLQVDGGRIAYGAGYGGLTARARSGLPAIGPRLAAGAALSDREVRAQLQLAF